MRIDLHVHTVHSDGHGTVERVLKMAKIKGLDGLAITDHGTLQGYFEARSYDHELLVLPGYEICTDAGHMLVIGLEELPPKTEYVHYESLIRWVTARNGITVLAHPAIGRSRVNRWMNLKPDAVEVLNASYPLSKFFVKRSLRIAQKLNLPGVAGSDAHYLQCVGDSYTIVEVNDFNDEGVLEAIRKGNVNFGGELSSIRTRLRIGIGYMLSILKPLKSPPNTSNL